MKTSRVYEIEAKTSEIEPVLDLLHRELNRRGYRDKVHLHEPRSRSEILELEKNGKIVSVEIDRREIERCHFRVTASGIDLNAIMVRIVSRHCANLIAAFISPIAGRVNREELSGSIRSRIDELIARSI
jgi:hypothetical protein